MERDCVALRWAVRGVVRAAVLDVWTQAHTVAQQAILGWNHKFSLALDPCMQYLSLNLEFSESSCPSLASCAAQIQYLPDLPEALRDQPQPCITWPSENMELIAPKPTGELLPVPLLQLLTMAIVVARVFYSL